MSEPLYELAFYGRLVDGVSLDAAKSNVTRLFKASSAQVDKMFAGGRVVIRNKLDKSTADKYVAVMRKNGLVCEIDPMGQATSSAPAPSPATSASGSSSDSTRTARPAASEPPAAPPQSPESTATPESAQAASDTEEGLKVLPLSSNFSVPEGGSRPAGFNLAGENVDGILQQSHLDLDPEGVRLSEHHEVEAPVFSDIDSISIAPTGSDLTDKKDELPPIVPDVSSISIAPVGSDMGQLKKDEHIEVPDLSHLKLDDLPDNQ